jgi:2-haloacid dehalogenase
MSVDYGRFDALTFDCYGTLIDWETGLVSALHAALPSLGDIDDEELLEKFGRHESAIERSYQPIRGVLGDSLRALTSELMLAVTDEAVATFAESLRDWPAFPDSAEALKRLKTRFKLAVITNCDSDLFAASNARLGVEFDWIITADMARSYKPDHNNFELAFATIPVARERILHVAQSLYHDHVPAKELGMTTVWIDRRHDREGFGATPSATASPDARFPSMRAFADSAVPSSG